MNPKRKQRLLIIFVILGGVSIAAGFIGYALRANINLFFTPSQIVAGEAPAGKLIRVGGLVVEGSVARGKDLFVTFDLTDTAKTMSVSYRGILPDLFREGQGIIAQGQLNEQGVVVADQVLAKHDETYMPPEVERALKQAGHVPSE